jgi:Membrane bound O-acyl transferase family
VLTQQNRVSWHQCLRRGLTGHADVIADSVLQIPRATLVSRYTRLFLAFLISGLIHHRADLAMGIPHAEAGSLIFFLLQPLGIMLEDGMQTLTRHLSTPNSGRVPRIVGYLWVMMFLVWSTPTWFYPQQRHIDPTGLLPFRIIGPLTRLLRGF